MGDDASLRLGFSTGCDPGNIGIPVSLYFFLGQSVKSGFDCGKLVEFECDPDLCVCSLGLGACVCLQGALDLLDLGQPCCGVDFLVELALTLVGFCLSLWLRE